MGFKLRKSYELGLNEYNNVRGNPVYSQLFAVRYEFYL